MTDFIQNLEAVIARSGIDSVKGFAREVGLARTCISRLRSGTRGPTASQLRAIAQFVGMITPEDLLKPHEEFLNVLDSGNPPSGSPLHSLRPLSKSLTRCRSLAPDYAGQYVLYAPSSRENTVVASLLELGVVDQAGIQTSIINPYNGHDGDYLAFEYTGFMVPVSDYIYVFAEQKTENYEVTSLIFHAPPVKPARMLEGIWSGIGVKSNRKFVSASPVVALRLAKPIENWRGALGEQLGYLSSGKIPRVVSKKLQNKGILIAD